jgi:phosphoribosyl-AMP cyclohydrolase / phosphoribosyl-ATP pyrophosphohydrolase
VSIALDPSKLNYERGGGIVTVVTQDARTGRVLMVAHADREAMERTLATGEMYYRSRSRGLWHKGETSGNVQKLATLHPDCDGDAVLARVIPAGPACHEGTTSCFKEAPVDALDELARTIAERAAGSDEKSYTRQLLGDRNLRLKKIGEEAAELITACADGDRSRAVEEAADLVYHALVALHAVGATADDVRIALAGRAGRRRSGPAVT